MLSLGPTRKSQHPFADLAEYLIWESDRASSGPPRNHKQKIYEPWLQKHVFLWASCS